MTAKEFCKIIDERQSELYELLSSLIKINSESFGSYGNEKEIAEYINGLCRELGLESEVYSPLVIKDFEKHPDYMPGRALENRYNVTARMRGITDKDELMLMAHLDTVEIGDPANWDKNPLSGEIADGRIWGRGACDDKYALATALFVMKLLRENGFKPSKNLVFTGYCDEEHGGSHGALAAVLRYPCDKILNMDGRFKIWNCASGGQEAKYTYHVNETVDSAKRAALALSAVIEELDVFAARRRDELNANSYYDGSIIPDTSFRYMHAKAGNSGLDLGRGELSFVFYTDKTKEEIEAEFSEIHENISKRLLPLGIVADGFEPQTRFFHYTNCPKDSDNVLSLLSAAEDAIGEKLEVCGSCLSDLSVISKYGSQNAIAFGAGRDFSLPGGAHQPNEFIECESLLKYAKVIASYLIKALG